MSSAPPARGPAVNVTSELKDLDSAAYAAIETWGIPGALLIAVSVFAFLLYKKYCEVQEARINELKELNDKTTKLIGGFKETVVEMIRSEEILTLTC